MGDWRFSEIKSKSPRYETAVQPAGVSFILLLYLYCIDQVHLLIHTVVIYQSSLLGIFFEVQACVLARFSQRLVVVLQQEVYLHCEPRCGLQFGGPTHSDGSNPKALVASNPVSLQEQSPALQLGQL
jgi:hypothetical protein